MPNSLKNLLGGCAGALVGYFVFEWFLQHSFYAMIAPGGLLGLGASFFRHRSKLLPVVTGIAALLMGFYMEWRHWPMKKDESFNYFLLHASALSPVTWVMIVAGAALGFYLPYAQYRKAVLPGS